MIPLGLGDQKAYGGPLGFGRVMSQIPMNCQAFIGFGERVIGTDVTFSEPDERLAIHRYLTHYAPKAKRTTVGFLVPQPKRNHVTSDLPLLTSFDYSPSGECQATQHLSESAIWS